VKRKIHQRDYLLRKARKTNKELDWSNYKRSRNSVTAHIRKSKKEYHHRIFNENINDSKRFWSELKKIYPVKPQTKCSNIININGEHISNKSEISNAFCNYFSTIGQKLSSTMITLSKCAWKRFMTDDEGKINPDGSIFKFKSITPAALLKHLKTLETNKGAGPDNIPPRLIKDCAEEILHPLCYLINWSLRCHTFPTAEKTARVTPVFKSGDRSLMDNYRPISSLNVLSKIIEKIVHTQLFEYLDTNNLLQKRQFGFRKNHSTQHAVTLFVDSIRRRANEGECTGAVYLDLRKAFDTVNHACLLHKLTLHGILNKELYWFEDYLFNRSQYVNYDNELSASQTIQYGVP